MDVVADTLLFALVPSGGVVDSTVGISVRNADGTTAELTAAFTAVAPILQFVNSATKPSGRYQQYLYRRYLDYVLWANAEG